MNLSISKHKAESFPTLIPSKNLGLNSIFCGFNQRLFLLLASVLSNNTVKSQNFDNSLKKLIL